MNEFAAVRDKILSEPDVILDDSDLMRALIAANERALGSNVVDLRGIAMERLEARLDRLEDTHRSVIAAAYENLSGTNQVHRAILRMLEPRDPDTFFIDLCGDVAEILRVDCAALVFEDDEAAALTAPEAGVRLAPEGFVREYVSRGRNGPMRPVTLRQLGDHHGGLYGDDGRWIRSEACLVLDLGADRLPALFALGAEDPHQFVPSQGTDLLTFFAGAVERTMRGFLA